MNATHWSGVRLVAGRTITEGLASRSWRIVTALMLLLGLAVVVVPRLVGDDATSYTLASVGDAPDALLSQLQATATAGVRAHRGHGPRCGRCPGGGPRRRRRRGAHR